jgi:hypothetical protein
MANVADKGSSSEVLLGGWAQRGQTCTSPAGALAFLAADQGVAWRTQALR